MMPDERLVPVPELKQEYGLTDKHVLALIQAFNTSRCERCGAMPLNELALGDHLPRWDGVQGHAHLPPRCTDSGGPLAFLKMFDEHGGECHALVFSAKVLNRQNELRKLDARKHEELLREESEYDVLNKLRLPVAQFEHCLALKFPGLWAAYMANTNSNAATTSQPQQPSAEPLRPGVAAAPAASGDPPKKPTDSAGRAEEEQRAQPGGIKVQGDNNIIFYQGDHSKAKISTTQPQQSPAGSVWWKKGWVLVGVPIVLSIIGAAFYDVLRAWGSQWIQFFRS